VQKEENKDDGKNKINNDWKLSKYSSESKSKEALESSESSESHSFELRKLPTTKMDIESESESPESENQLRPFDDFKRKKDSQDK